MIEGNTISLPNAYLSQIDSSLLLKSPCFTANFNTNVDCLTNPPEQEPKADNLILNMAKREKISGIKVESINYNIKSTEFVEKNRI